MPAHSLSWMIWYEPDPAVSPLAALQAGKQHFARKYGQVPNRLEAPLDWPENIPTDGLRVDRRRFVLPRCLHLACDPTLIPEPKEAVLP